jgi:acyl carrier protein
MTRDEIKEKIQNLFESKYGIKLSEFTEETLIAEFSELDQRLDSIEFMNFIFDVEDMFSVKNRALGIPKTVGDLFTIFEKAINQK